MMHEIFWNDLLIRSAPLVIVAAIFFLISWSSTGKPRYGDRDSPSDQNQTTKNHKQPTNHQEDERAMPDTPTAQIVTDEEHHRAAERSRWERQIRVARWLNGITAGAAIVGLMGLFFVYLGIVHADRATID